MSPGRAPPACAPCGSTASGTSGPRTTRSWRCMTCWRCAGRSRCPRQESNLDLPLRRRPSCPLDYEGASVRLLVGVERFARQLDAGRGVQTDLEQGARVVVWGQQREAPVAQLALVDGLLAEFGGRDLAALDQRPPPHQRHRRGRSVDAAPAPDDLVGEVEL